MLFTYEKPTNEQAIYSAPTVRCNCDEPIQFRDLIQTREGDHVCPNCGIAVAPIYDNSDGFAGGPRAFEGDFGDGTGGNDDSGVRSSYGVKRRKFKGTGPNAVKRWQTVLVGANTKGRYRLIFHWNERVAQLRFNDPHVPEIVEKWLDFEVESGSAGPRDSLIRADVIDLLRKLEKRFPDGIYESETSDRIIHFINYRERWKQLLYFLTGRETGPVLDGYTIEAAEKIQKRLEGQFHQFKHTMPHSVLRRKGSKETVVKERHNYPPFNYIFRKIMEAMNINYCHWDLPQIRSPKKLKELDDLCEKMFAAQGLPFTRSIIIKRPKFKTKSKEDKQSSDDDTDTEIDEDN